MRRHTEKNCQNRTINLQGHSSGVSAEGGNLLESLLQLLQRLLFDPGNIAAADAGKLGNLPLPMGYAGPQAVPGDHYLLFLFGQYRIYGLAQLSQILPVADPVQKILLIADNIHQRQGCTVVAGLYVIGKGNILTGFLLRPEIHKDLVFYAPGGIGGEPCAL